MVASFSAFSQWYVGGNLSLMFGKDAYWGPNDLVISNSLIPEAGYQITDKWAVGAKLGYSLTSYKHINGFTTNCFGETGAYVRFTPWHNDVVYIDFKAMGDFGFGKNLLRWAEVGIQPAIRFRLGGRFDLAANLGLLGARYGVGNSFNLVDGEYDMAANEWRGGLILGNNLSLSLYYNF